MRRLARYAAVVVFALLFCLAAVDARAETYTATVSFQKGANGYEDASDDLAGAPKMKLGADKKRTIDGWYQKEIDAGRKKREEVLAEFENYRRLLRWDHLDRSIRGENVKVVSAKVEIFYTDEFWSFYDYHLALNRSLDGTKDNIEAAPAAEAHIFGERTGRGKATPFRSWVTFELRPEVVQVWLDDPKQNQGLVLREVSKTDPPGQKSTGGFTVFATNADGTASLRPRLTITYSFSGNVAPAAPAFDCRLDGVTVGTEYLLRWSMPEQADVNGDKVTFEIEAVEGNADAWKTVAKGLPDASREMLWNTAALAADKTYRLRMRAVDSKDAASPWVECAGAVTVAKRAVPVQIGVTPPLVKLRRDKPYTGPLATEAAIELARNEYEGVQIVFCEPVRDIKDLKVTAGALTHENGGGVIAATNISVNPVGYVPTVPPSYTPEYVGLWPDPLLNVPSVDLAVGTVQPVWVTVYAPKGTPAGIYRGALTVTGAGMSALTVKLSVRVFDFELPARGTFKTMSIAGGPNAKFYGLERGPELDAIKRTWYDFLCAHRMPPGGYALKAWTWDKPVYPVAVKEDGSYDFSEAAKWGRYCFDRGMNTFVAAGFTKPGKWGFPETYSEKYYSDYTKFMTAYSDFLRKEGWLKDAVAYNIDEAPQKHWEMCKENYRRTKAVSKDIQVFQCLNDPKGVAALTGFFDVIDVNIGQFHQGAAPQRLAAGDRTWWCVCCWPSTHPNLFVDYPAMDARIIGWLSWKLGVEGFEYWDISSWNNSLKTMEGKTYVDQVVSKWNANSFGKYNGDGYLCYPGPNNTLLSSIRFEALRDGFEDYEYFAELKRRLDGKTGPAAAEAKKLLEIPDGVCRKDLRFGGEAKPLMDVRRRVAEAIEKLGK